MVPKAVATGCRAHAGAPDNAAMDAAGGALWMGACGLALAALAVARAGRRQPQHRGWPWWAAALALAALALPVAAGLEAPAGAGPGARLGSALLLAWPLLWLAGWRRFHARQGLPGGPLLDTAVLAAALLVQPWLPAVAVLTVHLYAAALAWSAPQADDAGPLRAGAAVMVLAALAASAGWALALPAVVLQGLTAAPALWLCSFIALAAMADRTEQELRASRRRLRVLAGTDPLTGLSNRRQFEQVAARLPREPALPPPVLLLMDIDHFKRINDQLGHACGDRALRLVGRCIQEALREGDLAVRLGGDEFALVLQAATLPQAVGAADRVVQQVQRQTPAQHLPMLTLSFGLVQWQAGESLDEALHRADRALYEAKRQGRACAVASHGDDEEPAFSESQRLGLTAH
jgi:diguanylate cyclase (GGDEF)-like protein